MKRGIRGRMAVLAVLVATLAGSTLGVAVAVGSTRAPSRAAAAGSSASKSNAAQGPVDGALYTGYPFGGTSDPFELQVSNDGKSAHLVGMFAYSDPGCPNEPSGTVWITSTGAGGPYHAAPTVSIAPNGDFSGTKGSNGVTDTISGVFDGTSASTEFKETIDCPGDKPDVYEFTMVEGYSGPTPAQIKAALASIVANGKLIIAPILKAGGVQFKFVAPGPGKLTIEMCCPPTGCPVRDHAARVWKKGKPWMVVATGTMTVAKAGAVKIQVRLTAAGKRLLKRAHTLKLTLKESFKPPGGRTIRARKTLTLKR